MVKTKSERMSAYRRQQYVKKNREFIIADINTGLPDNQIMEKYGLTKKSLGAFKAFKSKNELGSFTPMSEECRQEWLRQMAEREDRVFNKTGDYCFCVDRRRANANV